MGVDFPLAGEHHIRPWEKAVKAHGVQHRVDAHAQLGPAEGRHAKAQASGGPGPWQVGEVPAQAAGGHLPQVAQASVQAGHHGRVRALLGGEHRGGPRLPIEGVVNVAHGGELHPLERLGHRGDIQSGNLPQGAAGGDKGGAVRPGELRPQSRRGAGAPIVGAAAAQAQNRLGAAGLLGGQEQLPHAVGGGPLRVEAALRQGQASAGGHLDDGGAAVAQNAVEGLHRLPKGPGDGEHAALPACGGQESLYAALAAICHGDAFHLGLGEEPAQLAGHHLAHLAGGQGAFERIGDKKDFLHGKDLSFAGCRNNPPPRGRGWKVTVSAWSSCPCGTGQR